MSTATTSIFAEVSRYSPPLMRMPLRAADSMPRRSARAGEIASATGATTVRIASAVENALVTSPVMRSQTRKSAPAMKYAAGISSPAERVDSIVARFSLLEASSTHLCTAAQRVA